MFFVTDGNKEYRISVEVKSTKNDRIPGSSVQQIDINDWVIFLKHDDVGLKYKSSINVTNGIDNGNIIWDIRKWINREYNFISKYLYKN